MSVTREPRPLLVACLLAAAAASPGEGQQCWAGGPVRPLLTGVVLDSATRVPLQLAEVRLSWVDAEGRGRSTRVDADSVGGFRLCALPADRSLSLRAALAPEGQATQLTLAAQDSVAIELQADASASELRGRVRQRDANAPVAGATVAVLGTPLSTVSDRAGEFRFRRIPPGRYHVRIEQLGFGARTDTVTVAPNSTVSLTAPLATSPIPLPPLTVDVRSHDLMANGFYARRDRGSGVFLTRGEWERRSPVRGSDVLRAVAGVRVVPSRAGFENVVLDRRGCAMRYVIDNVRVDPFFQLDQLDVAAIEALEIYRGSSEVPGQFMPPTGSERSQCGVIVIWTRRQ